MAPEDWDFRWKDPKGENWVSTLEGLLRSRDITITAPPEGFR
jgi:hypothetical protein